MISLNNGKAFVNGKLVQRNILISGKKIVQVTQKKLSKGEVIDCTGKTIFPGAIDVHVHFRSPGFGSKEDWLSGSRAALHGGVTTVMDMPNTKPATTTLALLRRKGRLAQKDSLVNFGLYMQATGNNLEEIAKAKPGAVKLYYGSSTSASAFNEPKKLESLFRLSAKRGFVIAVHAEDEGIIKENEERFRKRKDPGVHALVRSEEAEAKAIGEVLAMQGKTGARVHIAHLSSKKGLALVTRAKKMRRGAKVTCEVTPNHLFLDSSKYRKFGNFIKCNPSIKGAKNMKALLAGLKSGSIDIVATDHAPHKMKEKRKPYWQAPSGIPGVETMLPIMLDAALRKKIPLKRIIEAVSEKPAELFSWKTKGRIRRGFDADLVIMDTKKSFTIRNKKLYTKAGYSPFHGQKLKGIIWKVIVGGNIHG